MSGANENNVASTKYLGITQPVSIAFPTTKDAERTKQVNIFAIIFFTCIHW